MSWVFDRLLRSRGRDDPEIRFRTELVLGFGGFELLGAMAFALAELTLGTPPIGVIYALASLPMLAILVWVWRGGDATRGGIAFLTVLFVAISAVNFGAGGRAIGANLSLPTLVLFAVLMSTPRAGLIWTMLVLTEIVGIAYLRRVDFDFPIKPNLAWVAHAVDRVPFLLCLVSALVGSVTLRALRRYRSDLELAEKALRDSEHRLRLITDNLPALVSYIDAQRVFRFNNSTYARWLGRPVTEITGRPVVDVYGEPTFALMAPHIDRALNGERVDFELAPQGNRVRHVHVTYIPDFNSDGTVLGIFGMVHDVSEVKKVEGELRLLAEIDSLTGLANRNLFNARFAGAIESSARTGEVMALLFLDLDDFKSINDSLGHAGGDQALQEFARRLVDCLRPTDTIARLAGDEFVIVLERLRHPGDVVIVTEKILAAMRDDFDLLGQSRRVTTSVGVAIRRPDEFDGESILRRADAALYAAKSTGRGKFRVAD